MSKANDAARTRKINALPVTHGELVRVLVELAHAGNHGNVQRAVDALHDSGAERVQRNERRAKS